MNDHPTDLYAKMVDAGDILACRWVQMACKRHLDDRKYGKERGLKFDEGAADVALNFFGFLKHSKGEWSGEAFQLEAWQQFIAGNLFGWMRGDGLRRFRTAYIEVARKNGKSSFAAGSGLKMFCADGEPGAEVYSCATKRDQAIIVHSEATRMVRSSPSLKRRVGIFKNNLHILETASKYEPLGADADSLDGLNVHGAIIDELHAHKKRDLWDVIETATGSRRQPLMVAITTAGFDQSGICFELRDYVTQILKGNIHDDTFFGIIYTLDLKKEWPELKDDDDWTDESLWIKSNPNLGISVKLDDIRRLAEKAKATPAAQNNFLTKRLNVWTQQSTRWISLETWDQNLTSEVYALE